MVKQELLKVADVRAELALVAAEYVRRYHAKVDTSKARVELAKLRESGLGDSLNAKKLASIIDSRPIHLNFIHMSRSRKKHIIVKDKTGRWYNKLIRRRNRVEVKQIANLTDMLEYNISQPYELVNPWDICDWRCVIDPNDDFYSPKDIRKYCCK